MLIASGTELLWRVSLNLKLFWQHRVSIVIGFVERKSDNNEKAPKKATKGNKMRKNALLKGENWLAGK